MRLNVYLRGIDLLDVEFHAGSKGLFLDVNLFKPREELTAEPVQTKADLSGIAGMVTERVAGPVWQEDQPAVVRKPGFGLPLPSEPR